MALTGNCMRVIKRSVCTTCRVYERKGRIPYDKRFPATGKHVNRFTKGGNPYYPGYMGRPEKSGVYATGFLLKYRQGKRYLDKEEEMIPEFIVPDLKDFKLKPYVSYKTPDVVQSEFTARNLFNSIYGKKIAEDFSAGKIDGDSINPEELVQVKTDKAEEKS